MFPNRQLLLLLLVAFLISVLVFLRNYYLSLVVVCIFIVTITLILMDYILSLPFRLIEIDATKTNLPTDIYIGEKYEFKPVFLSFNWGYRYIELKGGLITDELLQPSGITAAQFETGRQNNFVFALNPVRRGISRIEGVWLFWESPYKLFFFKKYFELNKTITILPDIQAVRNAVNQLIARESLLGFKVQQKLGVGSEFDSMREYLPGMNLRSIDWKQSAKHYKLIAKEYNWEVNHSIIMAFDTGYLMSDCDYGISNLDYSINAGLFLSYFVLATGDKVGVLGFDEKVKVKFQPVGGVTNYVNIQNALSGISYSHSETNFTVALMELNQWQKRRSLVILFSDFNDTITAEIMIKNVTHLNKTHLVLFVVFENETLSEVINKKPDSYEHLAQIILADEFAKERDIVMKKLQAIGVHCLVVKRRDFTVGLLNKYIEIKKRELI